MTWRKLNGAAIVNAAGYEIWREKPDVFTAWGPPGSVLQTYGEAVTTGLRRDLEQLGFTPGNELGVTWRDAQACLGSFPTANEARARVDACEALATSQRDELPEG